MLGYRDFRFFGLRLVALFRFFLLFREETWRWRDMHLTRLLSSSIRRGKVEKAHELRKKDKDYFLKTLDELKAELAHLRVTKVSFVLRGSDLGCVGCRSRSRRRRRRRRCNKPAIGVTSCGESSS